MLGDGVSLEISQGTGIGIKLGIYDGEVLGTTLRYADRLKNGEKEG